MLVRSLIALVVVAVLAIVGLWVLGGGMLGEHWGAGTPTAVAIPQTLIAARAQVQARAAARAGTREPKQILFGDLHVHSTFSTDAFLMSLPVAGGEGAQPVSDACDFARYCSALDFWSINDHALALTPQRWNETVAAMRQCGAVSGAGANPDVIPFLGWEWTQIGTTPENHYGHKNVVLKELDPAPTRPVAAPRPTGGAAIGRIALGLATVLGRSQPTNDLVTYLNEMAEPELCPSGVPVRELPDNCHEVAETPSELFAKLDDWGFESMVIPHGTTWGYYTPHGSSWDKQLNLTQHDPGRQGLIEVFSGHGSSEEYRAWREVELGADGARSCPAPSRDYLPSCWRAGEIIRTRCQSAGEAEDECERRAEEARSNYVAADVQGHLTVPGATLEEWLDAGQCSDCFEPAFNYRPRSSVQYIMALSSFEDPQHPLRFRFGFLASSDVHSARPGTGYKEFARSAMTEARFGNLTRGLLGRAERAEPAPRSLTFDPAKSELGFFALRETERQASFFLTGGLVGTHAEGRTRQAVWDALERREVYGTSGPRMLLWFDLLNSPRGGRAPMGSAVKMNLPPTFEVRAVGSLEQEPGCPQYATSALSPERLQHLCRNECYNPSDRRRLITRVEVVRIRPQAQAGESLDALIEDPWRVLRCQPDPAGCRITFTDVEFASGGRDALYYVRAIEAPSPAVNADNLRCERDAEGRCLSMRDCSNAAASDDCLAETEERAWSSPIFIDWSTDRS